MSWQMAHDSGGILNLRPSKPGLRSSRAESEGQASLPGPLTAPQARHRPEPVHRDRACGRNQLAPHRGSPPSVLPPPRSPPDPARPPHHSHPSCPPPGSGSRVLCAVALGCVAVWGAALAAASVPYTGTRRLLPPGSPATLLAWPGIRGKERHHISPGAFLLHQEPPGSFLQQPPRPGVPRQLLETELKSSH